MESIGDQEVLGDVTFFDWLAAKLFCAMAPDYPSDAMAVDAEVAIIGARLLIGKLDERRRAQEAHRGT